ncbi:hypothetical protein [Shewanella algae]|uniref:hypothetical protein n=1 Tax=Shewanella algae TaxID=38313 RepID=UPI00313D7B0E
MKYVVPCIFLMLSVSVNAEFETGKVVGYVPHHNGSLKSFGFKLDGSAPNGCNTTGRFYFDSSKVEFDEMVSSVIAAYHSNTEVKVNYSKLCNVLGNSYDVNYICIGNINC